MEKLLTILIPSKDRYELLLSLLKRLNAEDEHIFRVFISDNFSTDIRYLTELPRLLQAFKFEARLYRQKSNIGGIKNMIYLSELVFSEKTKYVCYCGDDDFMTPGFFSDAVNLMENSNCDFAFPKYWYSYCNATSQAGKVNICDIEVSVAPCERVLQFLRYDNDPMFYGLFKSDLLPLFAQNLVQRYNLVPQKYYANRGYISVAALFYYAQNVVSIPFGASYQGISSTQSLPRPRDHHSILGIAAKCSMSLRYRIFSFVRRLHIYIAIREMLSGDESFNARSNLRLIYYLFKYLFLVQRRFF